MQNHSLHRRHLAAAIFLTQYAAALGQNVDPDFKPELVAVEFTSREVRPGDPFAMTIKFRNGGTKPARLDYWVFVHFEAPGKTCNNIVIHADHAPAEPTTLWQPGQIVVDPHALEISPTTPPGAYHFQVGLYDRETGQRVPVQKIGGTWVQSDVLSLPGVRISEPSPVRN